MEKSRLHRDTIDFLLTPDGGAARRARRLLARKAPGLRRLAGPWSELMAQARAAYFVPDTPADWAARLAVHAARAEDAFWARSLAVAPVSTLSELDDAMQRLIEGAGPGGDWPALIDQLPQGSRCRQRVEQLHALLQAIDRLPAPFQAIQALLEAAHTPIRAIRVHHLDGRPALSPWQNALLAKLATDAPAPETYLSALLQEALSAPATPQPMLSAARTLFAADQPPVSPDDALRVLALRDRLEEVEVAAGMLQQAVAQGTPACDFGLLLPDDPFTARTVATVFARCGLPLSGLNQANAKRDLGRETVRLSLLCCRKPAPVMAVAALLTSPLMPWSTEHGHRFARAVMQGDVLLERMRPDKPVDRLMALVRQGAETAADLARHLAAVRKLLSAADDLPDQRRRALEAIDQLRETLQAAEQPAWEALLAKVRPEPVHALADKAYWQEGIAVFHEGVLPWRDCRHLLVLGFNQGHYPSEEKGSAVLTETEWATVASGGWPVRTAETTRRRWRALLADQLASATTRLTLLFSRRDNGGNPLEPSSSLVFLARRFGCEPDQLVREPDRAADRQQLADLALAPPAGPVAPRRPVTGDLALGRDLFSVFGAGPEKPASLSPSAAETLMVSPLGWLLRRMDCEPREWTTDRLDPMTAGTLAHRVFEILFAPDQPLPAEADIRSRTPKLLDQATQQTAPFLRGADWRIERLRLQTEIIDAAVRWRELLNAWGARVIASEQWLRGHADGLALGGQCDLLLALPDGRVLVVDYKKAGSTKRRRRMERGFDLQAHLYRLMVRSGDWPLPDTPPAEIGVLYYMLNDRTALADTPISADNPTPGLVALANDISCAAMDRLQRRIAEIRNGTVRLNGTADEKWWDQEAEVAPYALAISPLIKLFMHEGEGTACR